MLKIVGLLVTWTFTIIKTVLTEKPDAVLFNLQFVKFG
jgi:hypothetical protein